MRSLGWAIEEPFVWMRMVALLMPVAFSVSEVSRSGNYWSTIVLLAASQCCKSWGSAGYPAEGG